MNEPRLFEHRILICVSHPAHAPRVIARGAKLVHSLRDATGWVVYVHRDPLDEHRWDDLHAAQLFRSRCERHNLEFEQITHGDQSVAEAISKFIQERGVTQIVLGQAPQGIVARLAREPLGNRLLRMHPDVEQHIVDVSNCPDIHESLETGLDARLYRDSDGKWRMSTDHAGPSGIRGIFFRDAYTEFDHGYFVRTDCDRPHVMEIVDGAPASPPREN